MQRITRTGSLYAGAALGAAYLMTGGVFDRKRRPLIRQLAELVLGEGFGRVPALLPRIAVDDVADGRAPVVIPRPTGVDGNVTLLELLILAQNVASRGARRVFEFGTFDGRTTSALAANAAADAIVWTLDLPASAASSTVLDIEQADKTYILKPEIGRWYREAPGAERIRQLYGDSAQLDTSQFVRAIDFVFIDASHAYDYVLNDSRKAMELVGNGPAAIFWHDYSMWYGVTRALNELHAADKLFAGLRWIEGTTLAYLTV